MHLAEYGSGWHVFVYLKAGLSACNLAPYIGTLVEFGALLDVDN